MGLFTKSKNELTREQEKSIYQIELKISLHKFEEAFKLIDKFIEENPNLLKGKILKIKILIKKGDIDTAYEMTNALLSENKNNAELLCMLAQIHFVNKEYVNSENLYHKVLKKDSKNVDALLGLSKVYEQKSNYQRAIEYLEKSLKLESDNDNWLKLADLYKQISEKDKAIKALKNVHFYTKRDDFAHYKNADKNFKLGRLFEEKEKFSAAKNYYELSIKQNPKYSEAYSRLGVVYGRMAEFEKAIESYKKAARLGNRECQQNLRKQRIPWNE